ncbi:MAG: sugar transferase [Acidobacteriia bacterium]|nr:sugar transferase [Terriglobia bacterium]
MNALVQLPNPDQCVSDVGSRGYQVGHQKWANAVRRRIVASVVADILFTILGGALAYELRFSPKMSSVLPLFLHPSRYMGGLAGVHVGFLVVYITLLVLAAYSQNLYRSSPSRSAVMDGVLVTRAVAIATIALATFIYLSGTKSVSRQVVASTAVFTVFALTGWRAFRSYIRSRQFAQGLGMQHALIVGAGRVGQALAAHLEENPSLGYKVMGFIDSNHHEDPRILGKLEGLAQVVRQEFIDEIFITIPSERELVKKIVLVLRRKKMPKFGFFVKRLIDAVGAAGLLLVLSPFLALICLAIRLGSPGPIFYRASRVGRKGHRFVCYKFRTMVVDADEQKKVLQHLNERVGPLFKITKDPRVTRLGSFLRRHSIDELPQLWNVLKGDMSLVGPRPPEFDEINAYKLEHLKRLDAIPGITGLWQVSARSDPSFEAAFTWDNQYIESWSLLLDFKILLKTIPVVLKGLGR